MKNFTTKIYLILIGLFISNLSFAQILAVDDGFTQIGGNDGGVIGNVLSNDTLLGVLITNPADVLISIIPDPVSPMPFFIDSFGQLFLSGASPFGATVTFNYTICETANPSNCSTGTIYVQFIAIDIPSLNALDDYFNINTGVGGVVGSILSNDTSNSFPVSPSSVSILSNDIVSGISINFTSGDISVDPALLPGTYYLSYTITNGLSTSYLATVTIVINPVITLVMTGTYSDFNADGFVNIGDVVNYQFTVFNNLISEDVINTTVASTSLTVAGLPILLLTPGSNDATTISATYVLTLADIMAGSVTNSATANGVGSPSTVAYTTTATTTTSLGITDAIKMNVFEDTNANGVQDFGEINFDNGEFHYELNGNGIIHNITNPAGIFTIYETNPANIYNLSYTINPTYVAHYSPLTIIFSGVNVLTGSGVTTYNFPLISIPFTDMSVYLTPYRGPVSGFVYNNYIIYKNNGSQLIPNGTITFNHDAVLSIAAVATSTPIPNGFTYNFTSLMPGETRYLGISITTPTIPTVALGNYVNNTVSIASTSGFPIDANLLDNNATLNQEIRGSYDPNDKMESHGKKILYSSFSSSDYLTYTIRFENTGTGNAVNIKVDDVLNSQLDASTVTMLHSSAPYILERTGSNLSWKFNGIDLPPSVAGSEIGKGYIVFKVKPNSSFAIDDIIPNTANIYFDFNPAIITNTFQTEFVNTLAVDSFDLNKITIYPNPTNCLVSIKTHENIQSLKLFDLNGRILQGKTIQNRKEEILDLTPYAAGIYLLEVQTETGKSFKEIVKK